MPNHCQNDLRINGNKKLIEAFFAAVKGNGKNGDQEKIIDENKIIPYPKKYADLDAIAYAWDAKQGKNKYNNYGERPKDGYNQGGYDWCIQNWGTKWGLYDFSEVKNFKQSAAVSFSTAWSPPTPVVMEMSVKFPELTFTLRFYEMGAGFKGVLKVKNGIVLEENETTYHGQRGG